MSETKRLTKYYDGQQIGLGLERHVIPAMRDFLGGTEMVDIWGNLASQLFNAYCTNPIGIVRDETIDDLGGKRRKVRRVYCTTCRAIIDAE